MVPSRRMVRRRYVCFSGELRSRFSWWSIVSISVYWWLFVCVIQIFSNYKMRSKISSHKYSSAQTDGSHELKFGMYAPMGWITELHRGDFWISSSKLRYVETISSDRAKRVTWNIAHVIFGRNMYSFLSSLHLRCCSRLLLSTVLGCVSCERANKLTISRTKMWIKRPISLLAVVCRLIYTNSTNIAHKIIIFGRLQRDSLTRW